MKKRLVEKMLAVALAASMVVSLAACGSDAGKESSSGDQQNEGEDGEADDDEEEGSGPFAKYTKGEVVEDLGGYEFHIIDFGASRWYPENGEIKSPEDQLKMDIINDVETTFNCKIVIDGEGPGEIFNNAQPAVMSGDKYADLIGVTEWGFGPLLAADLLLDLNTVDSIDLTADYWNQNVIDFVTFGDKTYGIGGSFASDFGNLGAIFYNQRIWDELTLEDGSKLPSPRELLDNNEWTWDKLLELARLATRDLDGDGKVDSADDRYGITGPIAAIFERMVMGMGENIIAKNADGTMKLGLTSDSAAEKLNWLYNFFRTENVVDFKNPQNNSFEDKFAKGEALFMCYGNTGGERYRAMEDDWGIMPIPKWDASQPDYYCEVDSNAPLFCMTNTNTNTHEAGVVLTALARRFQAVEEQFINDRLDTLYRLEDTEYIVDTYIRGHAGYEPVSLIKNTNAVFSQPTNLLDKAANGSVNDIVSEMKAIEDQVNIELSQFFTKKSD